MLNEKVIDSTWCDNILSAIEPAKGLTHAIKRDINVSEIMEKAKQSKMRFSGFIIYSEKDAHLIKAIRDPVYKAGIDDLSGQSWTIFFVDPLKTGRKKKIGTHTITLESNENIPILNFFDLNSSINDTPCFVLFCWNDNGELCKTIYKLDCKDKDSAFNSICLIIKTINKATQNIDEKEKNKMGTYYTACRSIKIQNIKTVIKESSIGAYLIEIIISFGTNIVSSVLL